MVPKMTFPRVKGKISKFNLSYTVLEDFIVGNFVGKASDYLVVFDHLVALHVDSNDLGDTFSLYRLFPPF